MFLSLALELYPQKNRHPYIDDQKKAREQQKEKESGRAAEVKGSEKGRRNSAGWRAIEGERLAEVKSSQKGGIGRVGESGRGVRSGRGIRKASHLVVGSGGHSSPAPVPRGE